MYLPHVNFSICLSYFYQVLSYAHVTLATLVLDLPVAMLMSARIVHVTQMLHVKILPAGILAHVTLVTLEMVPSVLILMSVQLAPVIAMLLARILMVCYLFYLRNLFL